MNTAFISKPEYEEPLFKEQKFDLNLLNIIIAEHMFRTGYYNSGEKFCTEAKIDMSPEFKNQFRELS